MGVLTQEGEDVYVLLVIRENVITTIRGTTRARKDVAVVVCSVRMEESIFRGCSVTGTMDSGCKERTNFRAI